MRIAVIGRTKMLLDAAEILAKEHAIPLVWTAKDAKYHKASVNEYADFARKNNAEFYSTAKINTSESIAAIGKAKCDIAISAYFPNTISVEALNLFPYGVLNAHPGDLPRYRGNNTPNWAILNGESRFGIFVHLMSEELDAGDIVVKKYMPLSSSTYLEDIYLWLEEQVPPMLVEAACGVVGGTLTPQKQNAAPRDILRTYPRQIEDQKIDWKQSAEDIHRLIRASSRPFNGAFTFLNVSEQATVWRAMPYYPDFSYCAVPGQVCMKLDGDPVIACGNGMIRLEEVTVSDLSPDESKRLICKSMRNRLS